MKISSSVSVVFRQVTQVSEEDFTPVYGYEVIRDGVEIAASYEWSRSGLRAALTRARGM